MQQQPDSPEHHRQRSEFIRKLVQRPLTQPFVVDRYMRPPPKTIVQFWHDLGELPSEVEECVRSWVAWGRSGFEHRLFDQHTAAPFLSSPFCPPHPTAFYLSYHPPMHSYTSTL